MVELLGHVARTALVGKGSVGRVSGKELLLLLRCILHRQTDVDVLLRPVDDADEAELERVDSTGQDVGCVRPLVHQVELCEHADCPQPSGVDRPGELERVRVGEVYVGGRDGEDDRVGLGDVVSDQVADLALDVWWGVKQEVSARSPRKPSTETSGCTTRLISDRYLRERSGDTCQRQVETRSSPSARKRTFVSPGKSTSVRSRTPGP